MTQEVFMKVFDETVALCRQVLTEKHQEYTADDDRFHNFKVAQILQGDAEPATALKGMMSKHIVSLYDMLKALEAGHEFSGYEWDTKLIDAMNYLVILRAMLKDRRKNDENRNASENPA